MKNLIIACLFLASPALSAQQLANSYDATRTDWQKMNLKGNVKTLKTYLYTAQKKNGKIVKKALKASPEQWEDDTPPITYYAFSPEGYLTSEIGYDTNEKETYRKTFQYNTKHQLLTMESKGAALTIKEVYQYDKKGVLTNMTTYRNGKHDEFYDWQYYLTDDSYTADQDGYRIFYNYSPQGKLLSTTSGTAGSLNYDIAEFTYNKNGQLSKVVYTTGNSRQEDEYNTETRQYLTTDTQGNPTLVTVQSKVAGTAPTYEIYEYQITYY